MRATMVMEVTMGETEVITEEVEATLVGTAVVTLAETAAVVTLAETEHRRLISRPSDLFSRFPLKYTCIIILPCNLIHLSNLSVELQLCLLLATYDVVGMILTDVEFKTSIPVAASQPRVIYNNISC